MPKYLRVHLLSMVLKVVSGGTDNHLMLVSLVKKGITGKALEETLDTVGITLNKNAVPNDPQSPFVTSGVRIGTPAPTTRGMGEPEMKRIAEWISTVADNLENQAVLDETSRLLVSAYSGFNKDVLSALKQYRSGKLSQKAILEVIRRSIYQERFHIIGNTARIDKNRKARTGIAEVIFAEGKSYPSLKAILFSMLDKQSSVANETRKKKPSAAFTDFLVTRLSATCFKRLEKDYVSAYKVELPLVYHEAACIAHTVEVAIVSAGTSDFAVAEECAVTLGCWGVAVARYYDVGVAALERLLMEIENINRARVVVVVAGMEAALASVLGGLVNAPLICVPTSIGYGTHMKGIAALLGMLNSCAPGMAVVNIDNGFGAAGIAYKILHRAIPKPNNHNLRKTS
ncbi:hypothetical protein KUTeg_000989 [Tegillarca granosa]|uniref:phosphoribosylaminoimidazole carboxylase n=1 Tax=Tegillarca granosa TaxID=220873 RepID=A0ABQ9FZ92_TEGGR|nr:hypothetical protein KUTeg_000989 [Tegillarca granosa]